jgi:hypothetical protein
MSELVVEQKVLGALSHLLLVPADELGLECLQHGGGGARAVDENQSEATRWVLQSKSGENVGAARGREGERRRED